MITKKKLLETPAGFTWNFNHEFFLETEEGNFVWKDPGYPGGDNTIRMVDFGYGEWLKRHNIPHGRFKGKHLVKDYCGPDVKLTKG